MSVLARALHPLQYRVGMAIVHRVGGDDPMGRRADTVEKPGERWFTPDDAVWIVHDDAAMFTSGITALLLQSLHPMAMAGVAGHSGYKSDPWGRLERTSNWIGRTTFGTIEDAEALVAKIRGIHDRVRGKDYKGRPYFAADPHLLRWVHVAEAWSFLEGYKQFGSGMLTPAQADEYVRQVGHAGGLLGVDPVPQTVAELEAAIDDYRSELEVSPAALEAADFLLEEPPLPLWARPAFGLLSAGGVSLLPDWAASMLQLRQTRAKHLQGRLGVAAVRWGLAGVEGPRRPPKSGLA